MKYILIMILEVLLLLLFLIGTSYTVHIFDNLTLDTYRDALIMAFVIRLIISKKDKQQ